LRGLGVTGGDRRNTVGPSFTGVPLLEEQLYLGAGNGKTCGLEVRLGFTEILPRVVVFITPFRTTLVRYSL